MLFRSIVNDLHHRGHDALANAGVLCAEVQKRDGHFQDIIFVILRFVSACLQQGKSPRQPVKSTKNGASFEARQPEFSGFPDRPYPTNARAAPALARAALRPAGRLHLQGERHLGPGPGRLVDREDQLERDRKSTRLNSSH